MRRELKKGFTFHMADGKAIMRTFDNEEKENDTVLEFKGLKVYVDKMSQLYLMEATVDYIESLQGSGFKIENPQSTGSCGCGHSFSV